MKADYVLIQDRLKGEYKDAFQKVQMYSTSNLIGEDTESELMMELLDHMLMAQEEGKPVSTIVDSDYISSDPTTRDRHHYPKKNSWRNWISSTITEEV